MGVLQNIAHVIFFPFLLITCQLCKSFQRRTLIALPLETGRGGPTSVRQLRHANHVIELAYILFQCLIETDTKQIILISRGARRALTPCVMWAGND